jgi:hypothetical protein
MTEKSPPGRSRDDLVIQRFGGDTPPISRLRPLDFDEILERRGRHVQDRDEIGIDRSTVLLALASLRLRQIAIVRCDAVQVQFHSPEVLSATQHFDRSVGETDERYFRRSHLEVEEFIRRFADPDDGSVLYILHLDDSQQQKARAA